MASKRCSECVYVVKDDSFLGGYYCRLMTDAKGYSKRVSSTAYCDHFSARADESNSHYSGGGGCYLTSACVEYLGKSDDCEELTALRAFRDGYMKKTQEGKALVDEYYEIAPKIVDKINASSKKEVYYNFILDVINKCMALIKQGDNEQVQKEYVGMVKYLKDELL